MDLLTVANRALVRLGAKEIGSLTEASDSATACRNEADECRKETLRAYPWGFARKRMRLSTFPTGTLVPSADALVQDALAAFSSASSPFAANRDEGYVLVGAASTSGPTARIVSITDSQNVVARVEAPFTSVAPIAQDAWRIKPGWEYEYRYAKPTDYLRLVNVQRVGGLGSLAAATILWSYWRDLGSEPEPLKVEGEFLVANVGSKLDISYTKDEPDLNKWDVLSLSALAAKMAFRICYAVTGSLAASKTQHDAFEEIKAEARTTDSQDGTIDQTGNDILLTVRV